MAAGFTLSSIFSFFFPPPPLENHETKTARLTHIFQNLLQEEEFKKLWEEVNQNFHQPIVIKPSSTLGKSHDIKLACLKFKIDCPSDCQKKVIGEKRIFPHALGIYVKVEQSRTNNEIAFSIIFETCNAKLWPKHQALDEEVLNSLIDPRSFAIRREAIEFEALQMAVKISETIKQKTSLFPKSSLSPKIPDFDTHLKVQIDGGHFKEAEKQFFVIQKRTQSSSSVPPEDSA